MATTPAVLVAEAGEIVPPVRAAGAAWVAAEAGAAADSAEVALAAEASAAVAVSGDKAVNARAIKP